REGKFDYARRLAGALCYVGMVRLDGIELHSFSNKLGRRHLCTGGRHRFGPVLDSLTALEPGGQTDFFTVLREFITRYGQRGLVIVISDFLDDQGCERGLQFLADFGHELMLLQIWSEEDRTPPWDGELDLEDAETGAHLKVQFDETARARYTESFDENAAAIQKLALRNGGRYAGVSTAQPVEEVIFGPLVRAQGVA
ncbi:MAG TPA: hypothetical protein VMR62_05740, partial [Bryobacteraceae bacterium]|nr:hypothetical protein [Bryobacteraceae bacterium]